MALKVARFPMTGGLCVDRQATTVPPTVWTAASSIDFRNGVARRCTGYAAIGGNMTVCAPRFLLPANAGEQANLLASASLVFYAGTPYAGAPLQIGAVNTSAAIHVNVTPAPWVAGPGVAGQWTGGYVNRIPFLNHPGYAPVQGLAAISAGTPFINQLDWVAVYGAGVTALAMRSFNRHLFALGQVTLAGPYYDGDFLAWSNAFTGLAWPATPWNPVAGSQAGNVVLTGGGALVDAVPLGQILAIYKQRAIWGARYVGGNYVYDFKQLVDGVGALSQNCIAAAGNRHYFLTHDDVMVWDGSSDPISAIDGKTKNVLVNQITDANYANCWAAYMPRQREVWVCIPASGSTYPSLAIVIDVDTGYCGVRTFSSIAHAAYEREGTAVLTGKQGNMVLAYHDASGAGNGRLFQMDSADTANGSGLVSQVSRQYLDLGYPGVVKKVLWVRPWVKPLSGVPVITCQVGGTQRADQSISYTGSGTYTTGTTDKVDVIVNGRFLSFNFAATSGVGWEISGFDVGYELGGME